MRSAYFPLKVGRISGKTVTISMMVAAQSRDTDDPAVKEQIDKIEIQAQGQTLEFLNFTVLKQTLDGSQTETNKCL